MVTKAAGNRWQVTIKSAIVTAEWEARIKVAAKRGGLSFADFIVHSSNDAAVAALKGDGQSQEGEEVPTARVPVRMEDVATGLQEQLARIAAEQRSGLVEFAAEQQARLDRIERASRRGRWRR